MEVIAEYLAVQFSPSPSATSLLLEDYYAQVEERVHKLMATSLPLPGDLFLSPAALHGVVLRLPKKKAPGPDDISALRHLSKRAIVDGLYHPLNTLFIGTECSTHIWTQMHIWT
ncbi:hypothetical protein EVAR_6027_1 [Eumeta japonica]|uniref:Uncharacterized protein n=1 Tax=Eumeta variegata TaxID=151549 RepID=A0A4C1TAM9_EUMVA|nr:hypothetical protein EVAR_6027_1 [Eumeta japonica]